VYNKLGQVIHYKILLNFISYRFINAFINRYYMDVVLPQSTETSGKSFQIIIDEGMSENDKKIVIRTLEDVFKMLENLAGVKIKRDYFDRPWCENLDQPYCRPQYYIENCRDPDNEIYAPCIFDLSKKDPKSSYNYYIFIIDKDRVYTLTYIIDENIRDYLVLYPRLYSILGYTLPAISPEGQIYPPPAGIILSIGGLKKSCGPKWPEVLRIIAAHEIGEFSGLPDPNSPYYIGPNHPAAKISHIYLGHCSYEYCAMKQVDVEKGSPTDLIDHAENLLKHNPYMYCKYDLELLRQNLQKLFGKS